MRMMSIASGSSGNCIYIGSEQTHILIDAGVSRKRICDGLTNAGLTIQDISAVFITHEHSDHIKGLGVLSRKDSIPLYATAGTFAGIRQSQSLGEISEALFHPLVSDQDIQIDDLTVHAFAIPHDANEPVAYTVSCSGKKASVITDLGYYNDYIVANLRGSEAMLVEANHDVNLLQVGSYPYQLKQRILGKKGHLSNEASGQLICSVMDNSLQTILLGHLSQENNYDRLAYETVRQEIDMSDSDFHAADFDIGIAKRNEPSAVITI